MMFNQLFTPLTLRHRTLRNRVVFGAHTCNMAVEGLPGVQQIAYYRERAIGGAAMIVVEPMPVHPAAVLTRGNFRPDSDDVIDPFQQLTAACRAEGAVMIQQLYHVGAHGDADNSYHPGWSPSGGPSYHDSDGSHAMTEAEIEETIEAFAAAALRCKQAGFDGVEVWAAYHSLPEQFWTPFSNARDDRWGGDLEGRTRFSREVLRRIRDKCGEDFIVGLSISDDPSSDVLPDNDAMTEIVLRHDRDGLMDYVTCGTGSYLNFYRLIPSFQYGEKLGVDLAARLKGCLTHAKVIAESHIRTPENANAVLSAGDADLVALVRGQIADPHLVTKAQEGRPEDIRGCLSCNQMCWGRRYRDYWISCVVNPSAGREWQWGGDRFTKADVTKTVLVVGGGPAGLEAARVAAERGHRVTLAEAAPRLGGAYRLAGAQPRRAQILDLIDWYEGQLKKLGVEVCLNRFMDADAVAQAGADRVVLATGSLPADTVFQKALPHLAELPGLNTGNVHSAEEIMAREARPGQRVIVLDEAGNWKGCGTAWKLAEEGHAVTIVTPAPMIGFELQRTAGDLPLRQTLAGLGVVFVTESAIREWTGTAARVVSLLDGVEREIDADTLVTSTTNMAFDMLARELDESGIAYTAIGDGVAPRQAAFAIHDGRRVGLEL